MKEQQSIEPFFVKHYSGDERPTLKGNGFDGLEVGEDREEAEAFVAFINSAVAAKHQKTLHTKPQDGEVYPVWPSANRSEWESIGREIDFAYELSRDRFIEELRAMKKE